MKNRTYQRPSTRAVRASLVGNPGSPFPRQKLNLGLAEMQFSAVLKGLLALFSLSLDEYTLSRSQFVPNRHYFYANLDKLRDHIFYKWGYDPLSSAAHHVSAIAVSILQSNRRRI